MISFRWVNPDVSRTSETSCKSQGIRGDIGTVKGAAQRRPNVHVANRYQTRIGCRNPGDRTLSKTKKGALKGRNDTHWFMPTSWRAVRVYLCLHCDRIVVLRWTSSCPQCGATRRLLLLIAPTLKGTRRRGVWASNPPHLVALNQDAGIVRSIPRARSRISSPAERSPRRRDRVRARASTD